MALGRQNFEEVSEADLNALKEVGVPEGIHYEYKSINYGKTDADVKEFLKDVSSFANTAGGHLIIGMETAEGAAANLVPLIGTDPDQEILRLENLMRDGIEPRVTGVRLRAILISAGGFVIVVRIPRSWNPPHRVSARNTNRFYVRNSAGVHEASVEELKVLFNFSATSHELIRAFRNERISKISVGEGAVPLINERGIFVLHIVPLSAFSQRNQVDLQLAHSLHRELRPISVESFTDRFNFDGFINVRGGENCYGYTQVFRNGSLEATKSRILGERHGHPVLQTKYFAADVISVFARYLEALKSLEVAAPLIAMLTLTGTYRAVLDVGLDDWSFEDRIPIMQDALELLQR